MCCVEQTHPLKPVTIQIAPQPPKTARVQSWTRCRLFFCRAVALPGVVLPAGRYSFDAEDSDPRIVVVRTTTKIFYRGFTSDIRRPKGMSPNTLVTMGEAPTSQAPPITTWYEMGKRTGHEFRY
jgi:hypothetical protein